MTLKEMRGRVEIELGDKRNTMRPSGSGTVKGKGKKRLKEGERETETKREGVTRDGEVE